MQKLSENIIKYRKTHALTQEAFGKLLNVSKQTVSKWELGSKTPSTKHIYEICHLLSIKPEDVLADEIESKQSALYIHKKNHVYNVGLNYMFYNVTDFSSFSQFLDGYLAIQDAIGNKKPPIALLLVNFRYDDDIEETPLPIMGINATQEYIELAVPDAWEKDSLYLTPESFSKVEAETAYNNTTYAFTLYPVESSKHFLQLVLGLE